MKKNFKYIIALLVLCLAFVGCNKQEAAKTEETKEVVAEEKVENKDFEDIKTYEGVGKGKMAKLKLLYQLIKITR